MDIEHAERKRGIPHFVSGRPPRGAPSSNGSGRLKKEARGGEILGFWLFGSEGESAKNREGGKIYSKVVKKIRE